MTELKFHPEKCYPPTKVAIEFDGLRVTPGWNQQLSETDIASLKAHPDFDRYLKLGAIELIESRPDVVVEKTDQGLADLSAYNVEQSESIILDTNDAETLQRWLKTEQRRGVRQTINKRLTAIAEGRE